MGRLRLVVLVLVAAALWLPNVHRFYEVDAARRDRIAESLAARARVSVRVSAAGTPQDVANLRAVNPEWDFMSRTFTVLALANRALRMPSGEGGAAQRAEALASIDAIVDATLETETDAAAGQQHFLLGYAKARPFVDPDGRSLFIDGEILMMIAARDLVEPRPATRAQARLRAARIERAMGRSPSLSGESYPDECWTFCNTTALAALALDGDGARGDLARRWVAYARGHLLDPKTGILVSSYTYDGHVKDGAEGSSVWMSAHNLLFVDEDFAREQYARARHELGATLLGFGYAREWPDGEPMRADIDSGPIVPLIDASAGSSGFALLGASAFGDVAWRDRLMASLELAAFPREDATGRRYLASNAVGDAVLFYALELGPLFDRFRARNAQRKEAP